MRIEHIALWTFQLETMREFYTQYFNGTSNEKYHNPKKGFESYFISFADEARLEIMQMTGVNERMDDRDRQGWAHLAFSVGSKAQVDALTETLRQAGYTVAGEPRTTGDGYYESAVHDPDGNRVEITI